MRQRIGFCTTRDGVRIAHATAGNGPPLLRVGGWLTHVEHDWDSPVWQPWLRELTRTHRLARFDIRGSGLSDHRVAEQNLEAWVRDLEAVADGLGWSRFSLIGHCQGGAIALAYAVRHPDRVSRLVLYNSYAHGAFTDGASADLREKAETLFRMIELEWGRPSSPFREVFARLMAPRTATEHVLWWDELQRLTASPESAVRLWRGFHEIDVRELLTEVAVPTLVAHVRGDAMVPFELGRELAFTIPAARFLPLRGENHVLQPNDPDWPLFLDEMRGFLGEDEVTPGIATPGFEALTQRERAVLEHIAQGHSNAEISSALSISPKTVRNHVCNVCAKLGVSSRAQAIVQARDAGLGRVDEATA